MSTMLSPYNKQDNPEAWTAWECLTRTDVSIFLTGRAGTGKTTFLKNLQKANLKRMAIVAPTGVAAINAGGMTIHSFFQLPPSFFEPGKPILEDNRGLRREKRAMIRGIDLLVIDEISMVRPDLLDAIDARLREVRRNSRPFGGVQLLLIGDLMQLPPVVKNDESDVLLRFYDTPFFFSCHALARVNYFAIELKKIYRQTDTKFIDLLNKVRNNCLSQSDLDLLNSRYDPSFNPPDSKRYIRLTTHNDSAARINAERLRLLKSEPHTYEADISGRFPENACPAERSLILKVGAQVMFLKNDSQGRFYNGKIGHVVSLGENDVTVNCDDSFGDISVTRNTWQNISYSIDPKTAEVVPKEEGSFSQIPLVLAWSITIHKSQGLTFDRAIIDAANAFSAGQVYVALSRCRSFEGLVLSSQISNSCIRVDRVVQSYMSEQEGREISQDQLDAFAADYAMTLLADLFDFRSLTVPAHQILRILQESYATTYPRIIADIEDSLHTVDDKIVRHAQAFLQICRAQRLSGVDITTDDALMSRTSNGAKYFDGQVKELLDHIAQVSDLTLSNAVINRRFADTRTSLTQELALKHAMLTWLADNRFSPLKLAEVKALAIAHENAPATKQTAKPQESTADEAEVQNKKLYAALKKWRFKMAEKYETKPYMIAANQVLMRIADEVPMSSSELAKVKGMGKTKVKKFGADILEIVKDFIEKSE